MGKNVATLIPDEGSIIVPQMLFMRKDASEQTKTLAKELFGKNIQRFFSQLGALMPVIEDIPLPAEIKNNKKFYWKDWKWFEAISNVQ